MFVLSWQGNPVRLGYTSCVVAYYKTTRSREKITLVKQELSRQIDENSRSCNSNIFKVTQ
jgi:hypothetical protein